MDDKYTPLTIESLPQRLGVVSAITDQIGVEIRNWEVKEVGDGNRRFRKSGNCFFETET